MFIVSRPALSNSAAAPWMARSIDMPHNGITVLVICKQCLAFVHSVLWGELELPRDAAHRTFFKNPVGMPGKCMLLSGLSGQPMMSAKGGCL